MPLEAHGPHFLSFHGEPFDAIAELAQEWEAEYSQLEAGPNRSELTQIQLGGVNLSWEYVERTVEAQGQPPLNSLTFGLRDQRTGPWVFRGQETDADTLALIPPGESLDMRLRGGLLSFAVDVDLLARQLGGAALTDTLARSRIPIRAVDADRLRQLGHQVVRAVRSGAAVVECRAASEGMASSIASQLAASLRRALILETPRRRPGPRPTRLRAATRADELIRAHLHARFTVSELARRCGVGERTLRAGFIERFGHGPKARITALRLNAIRRALHAATPAQTVTGVASRIGVRHLGEFSVRYRRLFGETPSETLRRPRLS